jgi:hypothetical protein
MLDALVRLAIHFRVLQLLERCLDGLEGAAHGRAFQRARLIATEYRWALRCPGIRGRTSSRARSAAGAACVVREPPAHAPQDRRADVQGKRRERDTEKRERVQPQACG